MKKGQLVSKISAGLLVSSLVFSGASMASAKGPVQSHGKSATVTTKGATKSTSKGKGTTKVTIKSSVGKSLEKQLNSSEASLTKIVNAVNTYFNVKKDGSTNKKLTKKAASAYYNSYKGKLNAEVNKLRSIDKQLANYKKSKKVSADELAVLAAKSKSLQELAANELKQVQTLTTKASTPKTTKPTKTGATKPTTTKSDDDDDQGTTVTNSGDDEDGDSQGTTITNSGDDEDGDSQGTTITNSGDDEDGDSQGTTVSNSGDDEDGNSQGTTVSNSGDDEDGDSQGTVSNSAEDDNEQ